MIFIFSGLFFGSCSLFQKNCGCPSFGQKSAPAQHNVAIEHAGQSKNVGM